MAAKKPRKSTFASQAAQDALLRYQPQLRALADIQRTTEGVYATGVAQARGNADTTVATIDKAAPQVGGFFDAAGLAQARTASTVNADLAGLNLSPDLKAAVGLEQADASSRVSSGRAQALTGLAQQRVGARAGAQYATNKAHDDLVSSLEKIFSQRQGLLADQGTFTASETSRLRTAATARADTLASQRAGRSQSERNSVRSSGIDPDTGQPIPGGRLDPKKRHGKTSATGKPLNPAGAHDSARQAIQKGIASLGALDPDRTDRHHVAPSLVTGAPAEKGQPIYAKDSTGKQTRVLNADGTPKTTGDLPALPAIGEWATIAADVYYDGHLSRANQRKLADNGYSIRSLGLPTYAEWRKTHDPAAERRKRAAQQGGRAAGNLAAGVF